MEIITEYFIEFFIKPLTSIVTQNADIMIFTVGIIGFIFTIFRDKEKSNAFGNIAIAIGVLGTFIGISNGLSNFNVLEIEESIPSLLDGMRFAFETSILGMIVSTTLKLANEIVEKLIPSKKENIDNIEELFFELLNEMKSLNSNIQKNQSQTDLIVSDLGLAFEKNQTSLNSEVKNLSFMLSKKNDLLIEEFKGLNNSLNRKQDILIQEFREFGESMAHNNTAALVEALQGIIKEFNANLTEQFGENFKELNLAVTKLLDWQEYYKEILVTNTNQLKVTINSIKAIDKSLMNISNSSESLITASESINELLKQTSVSEEKIKESISLIEDIADKAKDSIPNLNNYFEVFNNTSLKSINNLDISLERKLNSVNLYVERLSEEVTESLINIKTNIKEEAVGYFNVLEELTSSLNQTIPSISNDMNKNYGIFKNTLERLSIDTNNILRFTTEQIKSQSETLSKTNSDLREKLHLQIEDINESTSKQIIKVVEQMEKILINRSNEVSNMLEHELKESLNSLGTQLATLSGKFVEDYTPLTDRLKEVVSIAQGV